MPIGFTQTGMWTHWPWSYEQRCHLVVHRSRCGHTDPQDASFCACVRENIFKLA